jgi:hypothetical protein
MIGTISASGSGPVGQPGKPEAAVGGADDGALEGVDPAPPAQPASMAASVAAAMSAIRRRVVLVGRRTGIGRDDSGSGCIAPWRAMHRAMAGDHSSRWPGRLAASLALAGRSTG